MHSERCLQLCSSPSPPTNFMRPRTEESGHRAERESKALAPLGDSAFKRWMDGGCSQGSQGQSNWRISGTNHATRGLPLSTSAKFSDFWTPSPLVRTSVRLFVRKIFLRLQLTGTGFLLGCIAGARHIAPGKAPCSEPCSITVTDTYAGVPRIPSCPRSFNCNKLIKLWGKGIVGVLGADKFSHM